MNALTESNTLFVTNNTNKEKWVAGRKSDKERRKLKIRTVQQSSRTESGRQIEIHISCYAARLQDDQTNNCL